MHIVSTSQAELHELTGTLPLLTECGRLLDEDSGAPIEAPLCWECAHIAGWADDKRH